LLISSAVTKIIFIPPTIAHGIINVF